MSRFRQSHHVDALQAFLSSTGASGQLARPGRCAEGSPRPDSRQPEHHKSTISRHLATRTSSASCIQSTHLHLDLFVVLFGIEAAVERALSPKLQGMLSLGTKRTTSLSQGGFGLSGENMERLEHVGLGRRKLLRSPCRHVGMQSGCGVVLLECRERLLQKV